MCKQSAKKCFVHCACCHVEHIEVYFHLYFHHIRFIVFSSPCLVGFLLTLVSLFLNFHKLNKDNHNIKLGFFIHPGLKWQVLNILYLAAQEFYAL